MSAEADRGGPDFPIVDCDVHVMRSTAVQRDVAARLDEPYRSQLDPDAATLTGAYPSTGYPITVPDTWHGTTHDIADPEADINVPLCEEFGVTLPIVNMGTRDLDSIAEDRRAAQEMRAVNDVLLERFLDEHDHFYGVASLATRDPARAAEEIDRVGSEDRIVGLYVQLPWIDPALGDPSYDVMWQAAADRGLPFVFHSGGGGAGKAYAGRLGRTLQTYLQLHTLSHPFDHMLHFTSMLYEGVPVKFPELDFVWLEAGLGWAAYLLGRMNRDYAERRFEAPLLEKSPEEHARDCCYFATQPLEEFDDPENTRRIIDVIGPDSMVFATDFPHFDFDHPGAIETFFAHCSRDDREKIFSRNAAEVFGLEGALP